MFRRMSPVYALSPPENRISDIHVIWISHWWLPRRSVHRYFFSRRQLRSDDITRI
jgi:hypothetical protein